MRTIARHVRQIDCMNEDGVMKAELAGKGTRCQSNKEKQVHRPLECVFSKPTPSHMSLEQQAQNEKLQRFRLGEYSISADGLRKNNA